MQYVIVIFNEFLKEKDKTTKNKFFLRYETEQCLDSSIVGIREEASWRLKLDPIQVPAEKIYRVGFTKLDPDHHLSFGSFDFGKIRL